MDLCPRSTFQRRGWGSTRPRSGDPDRDGCRSVVYFSGVTSVFTVGLCPTFRGPKSRTTVRKKERITCLRTGPSPSFPTFLSVTPFKLVVRRDPGSFCRYSFFYLKDCVDPSLCSLCARPTVQHRKILAVLVLLFTSSLSPSTSLLSLLSLYLSLSLCPISIPETLPLQ